MSAKNLEKMFTGPAGWALVIGVGAVIVFIAAKKIKAAGSAAVDAISNVNKGTPYEGYGAPGTLGHATDWISGGTLSEFGSWLGGKVYDLTHSAYDPNAVTADRNTPPNARATIATSPVNPSPAILPYSYKQANIDTPAMLPTDLLFTPVVQGGSSGAYVDDSFAVSPNTYH